MTSRPPSELRQWIEPGIIITLLVPMFYTAGWSFAYHYFKHFHLGLVGLDIPREYLLVYSYWAVRAHILRFAVLLLIAGGVYFLLRHVIWRKIQARTTSGSAGTDLWANVFRTGLVLVMPFAILLMFSLFYWFGDRVADMTYAEQVRKGFPSYPRVRVWVRPEKAKGISNAMVQEWQKGCYRLLLRNKDNLYLFYPGGTGEKTPTDIIPVSKTEAVRVLPLYEGCGG